MRHCSHTHPPTPQPSSTAPPPTHNAPSPPPPTAAPPHPDWLPPHHRGPVPGSDRPHPPRGGRVRRGGRPPVRPPPRKSAARGRRAFGRRHRDQPQQRPSVATRQRPHGPTGRFTL